MESYDPNICWANHRIEVVLQQWAYKATFTLEINGNCRGFDLLSTVVSDLLIKLEDEQTPEQEANDSPLFVTLTDEAGKTLVVYDDEGMEEEWLNSLVVSVRITEQKAAVHPRSKAARYNLGV